MNKLYHLNAGAEKMVVRFIMKNKATCAIDYQYNSFVDKSFLIGKMSSSTIHLQILETLDLT